MPEPRAISTQLSPKEQERFHNLLKLAADSPYEGERTAALAAAERLVAKHGMTLDEAARGDPVEPEPQPSPAEKRWDAAQREAAHRFREAEARRAADKRQWEQAWQDARARGLDGEPTERPQRPRPAPNAMRSRRRRNPVDFARTLLTETRLSLQDIADITDLDIYQVAGLKLKLRNAEAA